MRHMMKKLNRVAIYLFLTALMVVMIYPLLWILASSFRTNEEIFRSISLIPKDIVTDSYSEGWKSTGTYTYTTFFLNSFKSVLPTVLGTVLSSTLVAYAFARFRFRFKKFLFSLVIGSLLLPNEVLVVPRYILFNRLGWVDSYLPFIVPAFFATYPFFIFMLVQFFRSLPREMEDAAIIDGCNSFSILVRIILPLSTSSLLSVTVFQFVWRWNDFLNNLIYINSVSKYPVSLALRMSMDVGETIQWNRLMALSLLSMIPPVLLYIVVQKQFVEGIATTGLKG